MSDPRRATRGAILFVDDDPFYSDLASNALAEAGYQVEAASNGPDALAAVARANFDLIVLDLSMPEMSGFEVVTHIREDLDKPDLPILVITGNDDTASIDRAFQLGVKSFLAKPLNWPLFVQHVNFVLKSARTEANLRDATRTAEFMSDLKSRLVNLLVTEFQAPLRHAFGFATLLKQEADGPIGSPLYSNWIGDLHAAIDKLNTTHAKMLNFGHSLTEGIALSEEAFDLNKLVAKALAASEDLTRRRGIVVHFDSQLESPQVMRGDRVLLEQALRGLIDSSVRFSRRYSEIRVAVTLSPAGDVTTTIVDTSPPLSSTQLADILGAPAGNQLRPSQNMELVTALKLSRILIEAHQGRLGIRSVGGEGTRTDIQLPAARLLRSGAQPVVHPRSVGTTAMFRAPQRTGSVLALGNR